MQLMNAIEKVMSDTVNDAEREWTLRMNYFFRIFFFHPDVHFNLNRTVPEFSNLNFNSMQ